MLNEGLEREQVRKEMLKDVGGLRSMLGVYLRHSNLVDTEGYNQTRFGLEKLNFLLDTRGVNDNTISLHEKLSKECMGLMCSIE